MNEKLSPTPTVGAAIVRSLRKTRGFYRLFWGFCPACNSDAPEIYDCTVCGSNQVWFRTVGQKQDLWDAFKKSEDAS